MDNPKINGKPVFEVEARSVLNLDSGFKHKLLCDGPTFTAGSACAYSCSYCYVPSVMAKSPHLGRSVTGGLPHSEVVVRRRGALSALRRQLASKPVRDKAGDRLVCYTSPLVDPAANLELAAETADCVREILEATAWDVRVLSKSPLVERVASDLEGYKGRVVYGLSTGSLCDAFARAVEPDVPSASRRAKCLRDLQAAGYRTFAMVCPAFPQRDYAAFAAEADAALDFGACEHVWAEAVNARGESFARTVDALRGAGLASEAGELERVAGDRAAWESYSRALFLALAARLRPGKLRFMQYVTERTAGWWGDMRRLGALPLGAVAPA